ncbi:hypothetical protein GALMADRAFT_237422 [Galerina marginata CBS 339.88]|uniref:F-box domain-containing protein n=1 Tax=Galerina marginata (strain CBS 339.88) TaxID=685588 RepID=A0A067TMU6_GALM3|nr:hypothetical protein GALMADRAFT_237422 [Galerina marginata CBS 339.88]
MKQLPVELQTSILHFLLSIIHPPDSPQNDLELVDETLTDTEDPPEAGPAQSLSSNPVESQRVELNPTSPAFFPYNVARVCKLWRNILKRMPECWIHVVFDVAEDPTPFIDMFLWSKSLQNLEVLVYSSARGKLRVYQDLESRRISAIAEALQPHIHRCKSIIFDIVCSSSLPPPTIFFLQEAPHLEELTLNCRIDDIDVQTHARPTTAKKDRPHFMKSFPRLTKLSLSGFWFMYLALHARSSKWFRELQSEQTRLSLYISRFKFMQEGHYSLPNFLFYLCKIGIVTSYYFVDLSLSSPYEASSDDVAAHAISGNIHFKQVSTDFLAHLYAITNISANNIFSFDACRIPKIEQLQSGEYLLLTNIIDSDDGSDTGQSLVNILSVWSGMELRVRSCPSFNDVLLSWLSYEVEYTPLDPEVDATQACGIFNYHQRLLRSAKAFKTFPSESLAVLTIDDCDNFSSRALRSCVEIRNQASADEKLWYDPQRVGEKAAIVDLYVDGRVPVLAEEDKAWFKANKNNTAVYWRAADGDGDTMRFIAGSRFGMDEG